ncbi:MAG TPA: hypothetical protein VFI71_05605 [Pyrinomonadaceae bacterium]|nr:hypothetical protein [Pyrinomonadaceae bacterium]
MNRVSTEDVLNKAYRLAYFLHQDKSVAIRIVAAATLKLNVAMAVQSKRLYYIPVGRLSRGELRRTNGIRNKALFSDLHLLQRLIYVESEPYERQKERAAQCAPPDVHADGDPASDEDLLVYFTKHLVRITTKRNAFYVTLGVSRLLHSYSTLETMEIYNAVIGEPERVKDDYYYRSRKAVLMHEMYQRFGELIRVCRQRRGEERFESQPGSTEQRSLVRECLRLFTPWDTQCPVPRDFNPFKSVIASLTSRSSDEENRVEVNRIHAVLHPNCFERLVAAFGYGAPEERMELPRFFSRNHDDESPPRQRSAPEDLNADELAEINDMLAEQARRRRRSSPDAVIRIMVDGVERGRLNPAEESSISFSVEDDAELVELKTMDSSGELLLATHLLSSVGEGTTVSSIRLEGGQDLSLSVTRGETDFLIKFGYQRLWWQRFNLRGLSVGPRLSARPIVAAGAVIICVASYLAYVRLRSRQTVGPEQTSVVQSVTPAVTKVPDDVNVAAKAPEPPRRIKIEKPTTAKPPAEVDVTRSGNVVANLTLKEVKKIYIEVRGDAELSRNLVASLNSSGLVSTSNADDADAALKIVISQGEASAQLVNARGTVLWPKAGVRRYSGELSKVSSEIVRDLLSAIRLAR